MRHARVSLLVPLRGLLIAAVASSALAAAADSRANPALPRDAESLPYVQQIVTQPESPHAGQPTAIVLTGSFPYRCGEVFDPTPDQPHDFVVGLRPVRACRDTSAGWRWSFDMGLLAAGYYRVQIELRVVADPAAPDTSEQVYRTVYEFAVAPPDSGPILTRVDATIRPKVVDPSATRPICPTDSIVVDLRGEFASTCPRVVAVEFLEARVVPPIIRVVIDPGLGLPCAQVPTPWARRVLLAPLLHPADYTLTVLLATVATTGVTPIPFLTANFPFKVDSCVVPPLGPLPFVSYIHVEPKPTLIPFLRPFCPTDSILVSFGGAFPSECYRLKRVDLVYVATIGFEVAPPTVRLVVDDGSCLDMLCTTVPHPWSGSVMLGPLPAGRYSLPVQMWVGNCSDDPPPEDHRFATSVRFGVDSCGAPPQACLLPSWDHRTGSGACDAFVSADHSAQAVFQLFSQVPLAGLQGSLGLSPPGLRVTGLEAVGGASGMHLQWTATETGAKFVMFTDQGPFIPGRTDEPVPVLRVTVSQVASTPPAAVTYLTALDLLGSDTEGKGVPPCPILMVDPSRLVMEAARICVETGCDANGDGRTDVRDLVLMVRCLRGGPCPEHAALDCNGDTAFTIDDVMCCARQLLRRMPCRDCPPDTVPHRPADDVRLSFMDATANDRAMALPLRIDGVSSLGGARFSLRYPSDRYDVSAVEFPDASADWLAIHEERDGEIVIGLIRIADPPSGAAAADAPLHVLLRLALKPGQTAGGEVSCGDADFSGPDGVPLDVSTANVTRSLGGPLHIALSASRPNPFSGETRFTLTLDRTANVEVGIYDLGGRRVVALHRGSLASGPHDFAWNGRDAAGAAVSNGIYFYRASVEGQTASRKVALIRGN